MPIDNWWNEIFAGVGGQQQGIQQTSTSFSSDWWNDILAPAQPGSQWYRGEANPSILSKPIGSTASWNPMAEGHWRGWDYGALAGLSALQGVTAIAGATMDIFDRAKQSFIGALSEETAPLLNRGVGDVQSQIEDSDPFWLTKPIAGGLKATAEALGERKNEFRAPTDTGSQMQDIIQDVKKGELGELGSDVFNFITEQGAEMVGAGLFGKAAGINKAWQISGGYGLQTFADTYQAQAEEGGTGLLSDVAVAAASAGIQTKLEQLGIDAWMGRGAAAALVKGKLGSSRLANASAGALVSMLAEGGEEGAQQFTQILAAELPQLGEKSGDEILNSILQRSASEVPEAALGGAIFGSVLGGFKWGVDRPGLERVASSSGSKDLEARRGGQATLATIVPDLLSETTAKERAVAQVLSMPLEQIQALTEQAEELATNPSADPDQTARMSRAAEELTKLQQIAAENAEASFQAAKDANEQAVLSEADTSAEIASSLDATQVQQLDSGVGKGIQAQVQAATDAVLQLQSVWEQAQEQVQMQQQMAGMAPGTINIETAEAMQGAQVAFQQAAQQLGIQLSPEQLANPNSIDWQTLAFTAGVEAEARAKTAIKPVVEVIARAVDIPKGGAIEQIITTDIAQNVAQNVAQEAELDQVAGIEVTPPVPPIEAATGAPGAITAPSVKQGKSDRQKQLQRARQARYRARKKAAQTPLKSMSSLTEEREAVAKEDLKTEKTGKPVNEPSGKRIASTIVHLLWENGKVDAIKAIAKLDSLTEQEGEALLQEIGLGGSKNLLNYGAQVVTPYSLYYKVIESGGTHEDGLATVAVVDAWAKRFVARGRGTAREFYQRIAAGIISGDMTETEIAELGKKAQGVFYPNRYGTFAQGVVRIFNRAEDKGLVAIHELVHAMHTNGLLVELLDEADLKALEDFIGEKLHDANGNTIFDVSAKAKEKLAVAFTTFLSTHRSPNTKIQRAFMVMKEALKTVVNRYLRLSNSSIRNRTVDDYLAGKHMLAGERETAERIGDLERAGWSDALADISFAGWQAYETPNWKFDWLEIDVSGYPAAVRAMYHLLNAEPVHPSVGNGARSLTDAVEQELDQATGLPAKGWISKPLKMSSSDTPPSGYTMDQGRTPTPYEMRKMSGLTNDNFNGAIAEDALKGMEEVAELIGDVSREVMQPLKFVGSGKLTRDQKKQLATSLTNEAELAANQATQDMLLDGAPLLGSVLSEQYKEHVANAWIAGGKDAYFWGQKVDPTNPEQTKGMLHNFAFGMMSFWDRVKNGEFKKALQVALKPIAKGGLSTFQYLEGRVGSYSAPFERFLHDLGLPLVAEQYNNFYAISKLADKLVDNIPSIYDPATSTYKPIPGAKSWKNIMSDYNTMVKAFWTANKNVLTQKTPKEFHDAAHRDLKLWMLANRQLELAKTVAEGKALYEARVEAWVKAGKKEADKPKPPRLPHVSPAFTQMAEATIRMIRASWGSDAIAILDRTALELTKWENHMVLDKLLAAGMITSKEHKNMFGRGTRHIPFHRIRDAVERSGALNVRLDASMYKVLDYLKEDLSMSVEDPLNAMLRKAKAIEILTLRQHAKNEIGMKMLTTTWWRGENGYTILHKNVEITKEEFEKLKNQPGVAFTKNVKSKSLATGQVRTSTKFYKRVLFNAEDFANAKRDLIRNAIAKAKKLGRAGAGVGQEETDAAGLSDALDMNIFAFYPEEGSPRYVMFTDEDLARSVFYANNPQAVFARSIVDGWTKRLEGVQQDPKSPALVKGIAGGAKFVLGANKAFASLITSSPKYLYNVIFRDLTPALVRSRHGLRIRDIATTLATEGWAAAFPSLREVNPEKYPVSASAGYGTGEFSGLVNAINKDGVLDAQESSWLTWGRSEMLAKASDKNATKWQRGRAKLALMNEDFKQFMAKRGLHQSPTDLFAKAKAGELKAGDYVYMASSPFKFPFALMQMIVVTLENTTRLAERRMTMIEDMSKYPRLAHLYQPDSRGTKLAGFSGNTHRRAWEAEKKKMEANPTYMPEPANMPIMYSDVEKDYSMAHVTLNFSQRGTWTHDIQSQHVFWNPMSQDFYTNMMIIAQHSKLKGALNFMLGEEKLKMAENQPQLDSKAFAWFLKAMGYVFLPTIAMAAYYGGLPDDDPDKQEWLNQSFIEKMSYFHIPIPFMDRNEDGTHTKLRIATGLGMATLFFHDLPLAIWLDWASGQDPDAMRKWTTRFFDNTPLNLVLNPAWAAVESMIDPNSTGEEAIRSAAGSVLGNELINPMVELYGNYEKFRQKEIKYGTPSPLDHTEVARDRYNILTNTIAKVWPGGLQPSQASYLVRRYFPGLAGVIPKAANLGMEAVAGATDTMPPDVAESESPVYGQVGGVSPNFTAREPWGPGNEFVQDMYKLARTAEGQYNAYNHKPESSKPSYLAQNPLIKPDIYWDLINTKESVTLAERARKELLQDESIPLEERKKLAMEMERTYTLLAAEVVRATMKKL